MTLPVYACIICGEPARRGSPGSRNSRRWTCSPECLSEERRSHVHDQMHDGGVQPWTREEIIAALQRDARRLGRPPKCREWNRPLGVGIFQWNRSVPRAARPSVATVQQHFGSWNAGLTAAGLPVRIGRETKWTAESVLEVIRSEGRRLGRAPSLWDFRVSRSKGKGKGLPSECVVSKHFGSWNAAIEAAGFAPRRPGEHRQ